MSNKSGLEFAHILDGMGAGREIGWEKITNWQPEKSTLWLHFDRGAEGQSLSIASMDSTS